jgi:hypothetical protein
MSTKYQLAANQQRKLKRIAAEISEMAGAWEEIDNYLVMTLGELQQETLKRVTDLAELSQDWRLEE